MPTNPIYCFEHAATQTLVRTRTGELQVLRNGRQVAALRIHMNSQVSFAGDRALYDSGRRWYRSRSDGRHRRRLCDQYRP